MINIKNRRPRRQVLFSFCKQNTEKSFDSLTQAKQLACYPAIQIQKTSKLNLDVFCLVRDKRIESYRFSTPFVFFENKISKKYTQGFRFAHRKCSGTFLSSQNLKQKPTNSSRFLFDLCGIRESNSCQQFGKL